MTVFRDITFLAAGPASERIRQAVEDLQSPDWPYGWMLSSFIAAGLAIFMPWLSRTYRRHLALASVVVAASVFACYEFVLYWDLPPDTVLFQVELFLLVPLLIVALCSCAIAILTTYLA